MNKAEKRILVLMIRHLLHLEKDIEYLSDDNIIHLKVMGNSFCLFIKSLTYAGNPYPQNTTRAQLPRREEFETIKNDDSIFLFLGFDEVNDVFACWDPIRTKERLNEKQYVSFFSRLNLQQSVTQGNILSSTLQNDFKYVLFKMNDLAYFLLHITDYFPNLQFEHETIAVSRSTNGVLSKIEDDNSVKLLIDEHISMDEEVSDLTLMSSCMNEFGELYYKMTLKDWHSIVKTYREKKDSHKFDDEEETDTMSFLVAEPLEDGYSSDEVDNYYINEDEIEHVYVGVPSADPYIETEYEAISSSADDVNEIVETNPVIASTAINDFFPLFGVTLGKTTWKDAEDLGAKVEIWKEGPNRFTSIDDVDFWDHKGIGVFTSLYWTRSWCDNKMPLLWKSKGFYWDLSYDEWISVFRQLGYSITIIEEPYQDVWQGRTVFSAEFEALSPDDTLSFLMQFCYGEDGYYTSSPATLYGITVNYKGEIISESKNESFIEPTTIKGSKCLIYNDDRTEVIGCKEDDCENVIIPEGVTAIAEKAFENNKKIKNICFPESLISIGNSAFRGCTGITQIELNDKLESIGYDVFSKTSLAKVEIPKQISYISPQTFDCEMHVSTLNTHYTAIDGVLYDYSKTKLIFYPSNKQGNHYDVPNGILDIDFFAFRDTKLQSISLPDSIKKIDSFIFMHSDNLKKLTIHVERPDTIKINEYCFVGFDRDKCKLIVPDGCKAKYASHPMFKDFLSIEEMNTEEDEEVQSPSVPIDPKKLDKLFDKKTTSYKYFWFMAIISLAKERESLEISYKDIIIRMAALAWPFVLNYRIDLGTTDMLSKYLKDIMWKTPLIEGSTGKTVEAYLSQHYDSKGIRNILEPLLKNVPYRLLSPWIQYTTNEEVVEKSNFKGYSCLYALRDDKIVLNKEWWEYIRVRYSKISESTERSFVEYLRQRNGHQKIAKFMAKGWSLV